jgi:hypothetical protein
MPNGTVGIAFSKDDSLNYAATELIRGISTLAKAWGVSGEGNPLSTICRAWLRTRTDIPNQRPYNRMD